MADFNQLSPASTPWTLRSIVAAIVLLGIAMGGIAVYSIVRGPLLTNASELGTQGDFFGGHFAASIGAITLAIVIYTSYLQSLQQERFFSRQYFIQGIDLIATAIREHDSITALRLIEYYSRLALSRRDSELFLILNTVLCGDTRKILETPDKNTRGNYPFAVDAMEEIGSLLKQQSLKRKGLPAAD
jgi:hypothetical protein